MLKNEFDPYTSTSSDVGEANLPNLEELEKQFKEVLIREIGHTRHPFGGIRVFQVEPGEFVYIMNRVDMDDIDVFGFVFLGVCKKCKHFVIDQDDWSNGLCKKCAAAREGDE